MKAHFISLILVALGGNAPFLFAATNASLGSGPVHTSLQLIDLFDLENASDPRISPDGSKVAFVRNASDVMKDRKRTSIWLVDKDGSDLRPVSSGNANASSPRWSPDGKRLLYSSSLDAEGPSQIFVRWQDTGQTLQVTTVPKPPEDFAWSPDGQSIAFTMFVPAEAKAVAILPKKPEGSDWGKDPQVIQHLQFRADGEGILPNGYTHIFVVPAEAGTARQLTSGEFHHRGPLCWDSSGKSILFSSSLHDGWEYELNSSDIYEISVTGELKRSNRRAGPDDDPKLSPDGKLIAYSGNDEKFQSYAVRRLYVMHRDGSEPRVLSERFDRDIVSYLWKHDGSGLYFQYEDRGNGKLGFIDLNGNWTEIAGQVGGVSYSRPYESGTFSVADDGTMAFTQTTPHYPAEVAVVAAGGNVKRLTQLNKDVFQDKTLADVEEIYYKSSFDRKDIQGWIVKPPRFEPSKKYPLILEIHGGPFANYGARFSSEMQLYASAGYVVFYCNPRGSTSYGEEFANLIHQNYPGHDYDDLISGVDAVVSRGYVDEGNLFVTGGSGGGTLTAWIIGKTNRFRAAVVAKPVINWSSFILTTDITPIHKYWFPALPWENEAEYAKRSPISLVGYVKTPTMIITGDSDYRTPTGEAEQYFIALKLRRIDAALVRLPGASHNMEAKVSFLIHKVANTLAWFERYRTAEPKDDDNRTESQ